MWRAVEVFAVPPLKLLIEMTFIFSP